MYWLEFVLSAVLIIVAGIRLTQYADKISDALNLGKVWIGILLLGLVTSLPEGIASLASVAGLQEYNLAIGNVLGSNVINAMLIVFLDMAIRGGSVTNSIIPSQSHRISGILAIAMTLIVIVEIMLPFDMPVVSVGTLSLGTILIAVLYLGGMRVLSVIDSKKEIIPGSHYDEKIKNISIKRVSFYFLISAVIVVIAAIRLAHAADLIAENTGLGETFVGSLFLSFVTSLPELAVTFTAMKLGSLDLALGNIFGSNMTNIFVLFLCDLFDNNILILQNVSYSNILMADMGIIFVIMILLGIHQKKKKMFLRLGWDSILMLILFVVGTTLLYSLR